MSTLLNITIFLPLLGIIGILFTRNQQVVKWISLLATLITFILSIPLMLNFDVANSSTAHYLYEAGQWIPGLDIKYLVGLDGLCLLLFMLTTFMGPIVIISAWNSITKHVSGFYSMLLLL